jgi:hypothetical protein
MFRLPASAALLFALVAVPGPVLAGGYADELKRASTHMLGCYGGGEDAPCRAMLAAYERAMAAPDAAGGPAHAIAKLHTHTYAVYGGHLRKRGRAKDALAVLDEGYGKLLAHAGTGGHYHAWFDNQRLLAESAMVRLDLGQAADAEAKLDAARSAVQRAYDNRARAAASAHATKVLHAAYSEARDFETTMARYYAGRAGGQKERSAQAPWIEKAQDAYARAERWLAAEAEAGAGEDWGSTQAYLNYERGLLLMRLERAPEAERAMARAYAAGCGIGNDAERARLGAAAEGILPGLREQPTCIKMADAWALTNGDFSAAVERAVDRAYEAMVRDLKEPVEALPTMD